MDVGILVDYGGGPPASALAGGRPFRGSSTSSRTPTGRGAEEGGPRSHCLRC